MDKLSHVVLKSGKDEAVRRFHPWIFSGAIDKIHGEPQNSDIVEVYSNRKEFLGTGHYQEGSIAVRVFSFEKVTPDYEFWKSKLLSAYEYRKKIGLADNAETNVYRLVHAEGDGLPGLIIDYYNGTLVMQAHSAGMHSVREQLADALKEIYGGSIRAVYDKSGETLPKSSKTGTADGYLFGQAGSNEVLEYGHKFMIDWEKGQKTGFFIDQRENRKLLETYAKDKKVLNTFSYTGGFSVYALKAGASEVHSVDSSKKALDLAEKNIGINHIDMKKHNSYCVDAIDFLKDIKDHYDLIIIDPPAFAKHQSAKYNALQAYKRVNMQAIEQVRRGGFVFTFSCSQLIDKNLFSSTLVSSAILSGRKVKIVQRLSQPADHPVSAFHPEGEYLKGLILFVE